MWCYKRNKILLLLLLSVCSEYISAQKYDLCKVHSRRYEITNKLDKTPDVEAWKIIAPYKQKVDSLMGPVIGISTQYMSKKRPESPLSNLIADALLDESARIGQLANFALCNMGGIRNPLPEGPITWGDIQKVTPFDNRFCLLTLKGDAVLELLEQIASVGGEGVSGIKMEISVKDNKLLKATVGGKPIVLDALYTIATLDYLAEGNDNMLALKKAVDKKIFSKPVCDVFADYVRKLTKQGKQVASKIEGRITIK